MKELMAAPLPKVRTTAASSVTLARLHSSMSCAAVVGTSHVTQLSSASMHSRSAALFHATPSTMAASFSGTGLTMGAR